MLHSTTTGAPPSRAPIAHSRSSSPCFAHTAYIISDATGALVTAGLFSLGATSTWQWQKTVRASGVEKTPLVLFLTYYGCFPFYACVGASGRTLLETKAGMASDYDANVFTHCWCHPCALCQEARALKLLGTDGKLGGDSGKVSPARMEMTTAPNHNAGVATQLTI